MKKKFMVLDTETTRIEKTDGLKYPLIYDIAYQIVDKCGNVYKKVNYLTAEIFGNPQLFKSAYYEYKRPLYIEKIKSGKATVKMWYEIAKELLQDIELTSVQCAYNASFDFKKALTFTQKYVDALYNKDINEFINFYQNISKKPKTNKKYKSDFYNPCIEWQNVELNICDLWGLTVEHLINTNKYKKFCLANGFYKTYYNSNVDTVIKYLTQDLNYNECHTAFEDIQDETFILNKLHKRHITISPKIEPFPFRKLGKVTI